MTIFLRSTLIIATVAALGGCGAKGSLFLAEPAEPVLTAPDLVPDPADQVAPTAPLVDLDTRQPAAPPPVPAEPEEQATPPDGDG